MSSEGDRQTLQNVQAAIGMVAATLARREGPPGSLDDDAEIARLYRSAVGDDGTWVNIVSGLITLAETLLERLALQTPGATRSSVLSDLAAHVAQYGEEPRDE